MAQKVNSTNLRLSNRKNWNGCLCVHNFNDYSNMIFNSSYIMNTNSKIYNILNIATNSVNITKTPKIYNLYSDYFDQRFIYFFCKMLLDSNRRISNSVNLKFDYVDMFRLVFKYLQFSNQQIKQKTAKIESITKLNNYKLLPDLFLKLAKIQMLQKSEFMSLNSHNFITNLYRNIIKYTSLLLFEFGSNIVGIKIIVQGK